MSGTPRARKAALDAATLVPSKMLRSSAYHRPSPSLFFYPGLNTRPFHNARDFSFTKDFEANLVTMQKEYMSLRTEYGELKDDYTKQEKENTLNTGEWKWMNYIEKGSRTNVDLF